MRAVSVVGCLPAADCLAPMVSIRRLGAIVLRPGAMVNIPLPPDLMGTVRSAANAIESLLLLHKSSCERYTKSYIY